MLRRSTRLSARARLLVSDRVNLALIGVFLLATVFYVWRAILAQPLALHGGQASQYNQLADAFIHLHLWVVNVPREALGPGNPYNPAERSSFLLGYPDYSLYGHYLYITWGAAPVLVWLVPLHLLGFEPSGSVISTPFAIVGLGFSLATLRVILRQIGKVSLWMCILAAFTLATASTIPFILRFPLVYHEEIAGAYGFSMAAIWLVVSAVVDRRASLKRLALMSLCIGLATGSRPTLAVLGILLIPVYLTLRSTRPRRGLLVALFVPVGVCAVLLITYNQVRFGNPLEYGAKYQINGPSTYNAHFAELGYLAPGLWAYLFTPPRLVAIFPFLPINYPQVSYPFHLPAHYAPLSEETGGLFVMAPIAVFLLALPWVWRRRPALLGRLGPLLLVIAAAGVVAMAFVAYEIYITTERYETDYITLLLLGALAVWLALSSEPRIRGRRLIRIGGGALAVWSCVTGLAMSLEELQAHTGTWRTLVNLGSPLSTGIADVVGHPVLAEVITPDLQGTARNYSNFGTEATGFSLRAGGQARITIVSPDSRRSELVANTSAGPASGGAPLQARIDGPGQTSHIYGLSSGGGQVRMSIHLSRGVNQLVLEPVLAGAGGAVPSAPEAPPVMTLTNFALASH